MSSARADLSIFDKFNFEIKPIGIQLLLKKPESVERLEKKLALCEMFKEAQEAERPFYTDFENHTCGGGIGTLGLEVPKTANWLGAGAAIASGRLGPKFKIFQHPVANRRTLLTCPRLATHSVKYVLFSRLDQITFDPDVLLITARPRQAEIILRSYSYTTGVPWETKTTSIMGCS